MGGCDLRRSFVSLTDQKQQRAAPSQYTAADVLKSKYAFTSRRELENGDHRRLGQQKPQSEQEASNVIR